MPVSPDKPRHWIAGLAIWAGVAVGVIVAFAIGESPPGGERAASDFIYVTRVLGFALLGGAIGAICGAIVQMIRRR